MEQYCELSLRGIDDCVQENEGRLPNNLVLYDGVCGLCTRSVRFLLIIDSQRRLTFAPLQGETANRLVERFPRIKVAGETILFLRRGERDEFHLYERSSSILEILSAVGGIWRLFNVFRIIPIGARDSLYDWVARRRYLWFGRYDECQIPSRKHGGRFLS